MSDKYEILTDRTIDGLDEQINDMAEKGYELDKFEQNNYYDGEWQGIAIMKRMDKPTSNELALNIDLVMLSREQIAKQMGWDDYAEMMLNEDNIEPITKGAINMIFAAYKLKMPFY